MKCIELASGPHNFLHTSSLNIHPGSQQFISRHVSKASTYQLANSYQQTAESDSMLKLILLTIITTWSQHSNVQNMNWQTYEAVKQDNLGAITASNKSSQYNQKHTLTSRSCNRIIAWI